MFSGIHTVLKNNQFLALTVNYSTKNTRKFFSKMSQAEKPKITALDDARLFMVNCFKAVGCNQTNAEIVADNLLEADYRGHYSHGMNRLEMYIKDVQSGLTDGNVVPTVEKETVATAVVNGNNGFGAVVGKFCMDLAIEKASCAGIGIVVAHHSNHYGIAGMFSLQAIKNRFIGFTCTNTSPLMVPTRAKKSALGTNPIALGVPGNEGDSFVLDMATSAVALGKIEMLRRKGAPVPEGWAVNEEGKNETDAAKAVKAARLLPVGGEEKNSGYKGYGLGMMVEILCGVLSGSAMGPNIRQWTNTNVIANLGQCFIAIDPQAFVPGVELRMSCLMDTIRKMEPIDPCKPVLVAGDPERIHMEKVHKDGGLLYVNNQHETNSRLAEKLKVPSMKSC